MNAPRTVEWSGERSGHVRLIEQTLLPGELRILDVRSVPAMVDAIRRLAVRGAPAIGVAAGYGVLLGLQQAPEASAAELFERARAAAAELAEARPTAVNLFSALGRMLGRAERSLAAGDDGPAFQDALLAEAHAMAAELEDECRRMGEHGVALLHRGARVLTHCNAGALATVGIGTALAPVYVAHERGLGVSVFADETRPLLQGARLTAWELSRAGIDVTLLVDGAAASLLASGRVDVVFVGADRIARNGDVCNKIGTYPLAVLAREHGVPFYAIAPLSTFDEKAASGAEIPIEQRPAEELTQGPAGAGAPSGIRVHNPAFDVTPASKVSGLVTELGVLRDPDREGVEALLRRAGRI